MKVILFGATGMVGQGVLRECLVDPEVRTILSVGRSTTGLQNKKLRELVHTDFLDYSAMRVSWPASMRAFSAWAFRRRGCPRIAIAI